MGDKIVVTVDVCEGVTSKVIEQLQTAIEYALDDIHYSLSAGNDYEVFTWSTIWETEG